MLFCLGGIIDFIKLGAGIIIVSVFFIILLVFHLVDMTINETSTGYKFKFVMVDNMEWFNVFGLIFYCSHYDTQCCICD